LQRGLERDADVEGNREIWDNWQTFESAFHEADGTRARADLIVDGTAPYGAAGEITVR
jgi:hypothetical protein